MTAIAAVVFSASPSFSQTISDVPAPRHYTFKSFSVPLPLTVATAGLGINNRGAVVGIYNRKGEQLGFKRDADGVFEFPILGATNRQPAAATGIDDLGEIVGYSYDGTKYHGFLLKGSVRGTYSLMDVAPNLGVSPEAHTYITGLNNLGDFVGYVSCNKTGCGGTHGFANIAGTFNLIDVPDKNLVDVDVTFPQAIAWDGTIVGCYQDLNQRLHAFLRGPNGQFLRFEVAGGDAPCATGVNNDAHTIVGTFHGNDFRDHSFVYDYAAAFASFARDSRTVIRTIQAQVLEFPGVGTTYLTGINAKGTVVGSFVPSEGYQVAFIATPD